MSVINVPCVDHAWSIESKPQIVKAGKSAEAFCATVFFA